MAQGLEQGKFTAAIFRRGQKKELFHDGDEEFSDDEDLNNKLQDLHEVWGLSRTGKDLSAAIWRPEHRAAEVVLQKGKLFSHMGFTRGSKMYIHPEEALYMVDRANLLVFLDERKTGKRLLSFQEVQDLMVGCGVPMSIYLVYCKLMRAGYIVQRHPSRWLLKPSESPRDIFPDSLHMYTQAELQNEVDSYPAKRQKRTNPSLQPAPPANALPETKVEQEKDQAKETKPSPSGRAWWGARNSNTNWLHGAAPMDESACKDMPRCIVEIPNESASRRDFPNMQPLPRVPADVVWEATHLSDSEAKKLLHLDVYASNSQFSRKAPGKPLFLVSVWPENYPPSVQTLAAIETAADGIPIRYAAVEFGDIGFYGMPHTELKNIFR